MWRVVLFVIVGAVIYRMIRSSISSDPVQVPPDRGRDRPSGGGHTSDLSYGGETYLTSRVRVTVLQRRTGKPWPRQRVAFAADGFS